MISQGNLREIINGSLLKKYVGRKVSITGKINSTAPNGLGFEMMSSDDVLIKVTLKKAYHGPLEGYVEVQGVPSGNSIICEELVVFNNEANSDFDAHGYNSVVRFLTTAPNLWNHE